MDRHSFELLAQRLRRDMLGVAASIVGHTTGMADDVVQEAMLKLWFFRDRLADYDSADAQAMVIVRRVALNMLRSCARSVTIAVETEKLPDREDELDDADSFLSDELLAAIDSLPSTEQAVLRLKHIDGMEIDEIASLTGSSSGAVRTALSRARRKIRDRFIK